MEGEEVLAGYPRGCTAWTTNMSRKREETRSGLNRDSAQASDHLCAILLSGLGSLAIGLPGVVELTSGEGEISPSPLF